MSNWGGITEPVRLLRLGRVPDWQSQAAYHAVAQALSTDSPDTLILCQPASPYLCLGYHQSFDAVLDRAECQRRHLPVFRRQVGGGTTYLDSNQTFYQCVFHRSRVSPVFAEIFAQMLQAPVAVLRRLGVNAILREVNEIEVDGKRIAGTGGGQIGESCVVVGNLLCDFDYETMARVLRVPSRKCRSLIHSALRDSITTLHQWNRSVEVDALEQLLVEEFACALNRPLAPGVLSPPRTRAHAGREQTTEFDRFFELAFRHDPQAHQDLRTYDHSIRVHRDGYAGIPRYSGRAGWSCRVCAARARYAMGTGSPSPTVQRSL